MQESVKRRIPVAAHRGHSARYPENTLAAFRAAMDAGADVLECDLHMTADGEIVVIHDHTADRTTDGTGLIRDMTLAQVKALDAGSWKDAAFAGERVPTLTEFLELVAGQEAPALIIELKDYPNEQGEERAFLSADRTIALLERYGVAARCIINSFSAKLLEHIDSRYEGRYRLHGYHPFFLSHEVSRSPYDYLFCLCLFARGRDEDGRVYRLADPVPDRRFFEEALRHGVEPWVCYPDEDEEVFRRSAENGARLITANDPQRALALLRRLGYHE